MPIVSLFYDGSGGQNRRVEVFLINTVCGRRGVAGLSGKADAKNLLSRVLEGSRDEA
jgi:hypothetical protein